MTELIPVNQRRARLVMGVGILAVAVICTMPFLLGGQLVLSVVAAVIGAGLGFLAYRNPEALVVRAIRARPANLDDHARLHNLVDSLCAASGLPKPALYVIDEAALNAAAFGREPRRAGIAITSALLDGLDRIELEGVLAHELARIKAFDTAPATVAVGLRHLGSRVVERAAGPRHELLADQAGVALTRYPPGLLAALEKVAAGSSDVRMGYAATGHLWLVPPASTRAPLDERISALQEL